MNNPKKSREPNKNFPIEVRVYNKYPMEVQAQYIRFSAKLTQHNERGKLIFHKEVTRRDWKKAEEIAKKWKTKYLK